MRPRVRCSTPRRTHLPPQLGSPVGTIQNAKQCSATAEMVPLAHAGRMFPPRRNFRVRQTLDSFVVFDFQFAKRSPLATSSPSVSESVVRILNELILKLNETLLSSPPFRDGVFERGSDSREDLGAGRADFLLK